MRADVRRPRGPPVNRTTGPSPPEDEVSDLAAWRDNAATWIAHSERTAAMTRGASDALVACLAPAPGQRVLDVACGAGDPALRLARAVGPTGHVLATDGVVEMLDALRCAAAAAGLTWLHTHHAAAEDLPPDARDFDAAGCRFGAMFFADPLRALANMGRAVRPGGRLAVMVWGPPEANPYFTLTASVLDELQAPSLPAGKTVFEFDDGLRLTELATRAGWQSVALERVPFEMALPDETPDTLLEAHRSLSGKVARRLQDLAEIDPSGIERARDMVATRAAPFATQAGLLLPAEALLLKGQAPT